MFECDHCKDFRLPGLQELHLNYDFLLAHNTRQQNFCYFKVNGCLGLFGGANFKSVSFALTGHVFKLFGKTF